MSFVLRLFIFKTFVLSPFKLSFFNISFFDHSTSHALIFFSPSYHMAYHHSNLHPSTLRSSTHSSTFHYFHPSAIRCFPSFRSSTLIILGPIFNLNLLFLVLSFSDISPLNSFFKLLSQILFSYFKKELIRNHHQQLVRILSRFTTHPYYNLNWICSRNKSKSGKEKHSSRISCVLHQLEKHSRFLTTYARSETSHWILLIE